MASILCTKLSEILTVFTATANEYGFNNQPSTYTKKEIPCFSDEGSSKNISVNEKEVRLTTSYLVLPADKPNIDDMILLGKTIATTPSEAGAREIGAITEEYTLCGASKKTEGWSVWQK